MGANSLSKTVTRQRRDCDLNSDLSAPESSTLTTRLPTVFSVYSRHLFGVGEFPLPQNLQFSFPQMDAKLSAINLFFSAETMNISWKLSFNGQRTQEIIRH